MADESINTTPGSAEKAAEVNYESMGMGHKLFLKLAKWALLVKPVADTANRTADYLAGGEPAKSTGVIGWIEDFYARQNAKFIRNETAQESAKERQGDDLAWQISKKLAGLHPGSDLNAVVNGPMGRIFEIEALPQTTSITNGVDVKAHGGIPITPKRVDSSPANGPKK